MLPVKMDRDNFSMLPFGYLCLLQIKGERHMGEDRNWGIKRLIEQNLADGIGHVV